MLAIIAIYVVLGVGAYIYAKRQEKVKLNEKS